MTSLATLLWDLLSAAGGTLALTFIVALALGINALALLFFGSAVVALERFARVVTSWRTTVSVWLLWSLLMGVAFLHADRPEIVVESLSVQLRGLGVAWGAGALAVVFASVSVLLLLRWFSSSVLARTALGALGFGYALIVGGTAQLSFATAPLLVSLSVALLLRFKRLRAQDARISTGEKMAWVLAVSLLSGPALATILPEPDVRVATAGVSLLAAFGSLVVLGLLPMAAAGLLDSRKGVEWFIARRYLVAKRRQTFISVITGICVVGIAAGVWLIITVLSVMNGFERTWREEISGNRAHFTVHSGLGPFGEYESVVARLEGFDDVVAVSPYLDAEGMVRGDAGEIMAVRVRGVDPTRVGSVTDLENDLTAGSLTALRDGEPGEDPGIVIGSQLASALALGIDDPMVVISPFGGPQTPLGPAPRLMRFRVVGVFESTPPRGRKRLLPSSQGR